MTETEVAGVIVAIATGADVVVATVGSVRHRSRPRRRGKSQSRQRSAKNSPPPARRATARSGILTKSRPRRRPPLPEHRVRNAALILAATTGVAGTEAGTTARASPADGTNAPAKSDPAKSVPGKTGRGKIVRVTIALGETGGDRTAVGPSHRVVSLFAPSGRHLRGIRETRTKRPSTCPLAGPAWGRRRELLVQPREAKPGRRMRVSGGAVGGAGGSPAEPRERRACRVMPTTATTSTRGDRLHRSPTVVVATCEPRRFPAAIGTIRKRVCPTFLQPALQRRVGTNVARLAASAGRKAAGRKADVKRVGVKGTGPKGSVADRAGAMPHGVRDRGAREPAAKARVATVVAAKVGGAKVAAAKGAGEISVVPSGVSKPTSLRANR